MVRLGERPGDALTLEVSAPIMGFGARELTNPAGHQLEERTIREELEGNICRCTGYHNIVKSIAAGARAMGGGA